MTPRAYRRRQVARLYGASLRAIDQAIRAGEIRVKRRGRCLYLNAEDVERTFGFPSETEEIEPSAETVAELAEFLRSCDA